MATAVRLAEGDHFDYTPNADVTGGDVIDLGDFVGIAEVDIPANTQGAIAVEGIFQVTKKTGETWVLGAPIYWDADTTSFTNTSAYSDGAAGVAAAAAASGDATGIVKLTPGLHRA